MTTIFQDIVLFLQDHLPFLYYILLTLGASTVLRILLEIVAGCVKLLRKRIDFRKRYGEGAWALVTGSSEGTPQESQALGESWLTSWQAKVSTSCYWPAPNPS
jgi:hypothetical protein